MTTASGTRIPELLAPAGNMEKLETAILYGADAVYLGGRDLNLRASAGGFGPRELRNALRLAKNAGVRAYYLLNVLPRQNLLGRAKARLERLGELAAEGLGPDAVIVADVGVARMVRRFLPEMPMHVSTQANTANSQAVRFWSEYGARRVNVAREVRASELLDMLRACRRSCPAELEVFVHGAQCVALSGHCLLSAALNDRPANLGQCSHPCRYEYRAAREDGDAEPAPLPLEEATRPGETMWLAEEHAHVVDGAEGDTGEGYTALLAANDLCLIHYLDWLARMGVAAVKIEGRAKSSAYLAQVTDAYATALARLADPGTEGFDPSEPLAELVNAASRPLCTGFFDAGEQRVIARPPDPDRVRPVLCRLVEGEAPGRYLVEVKHRWKVTETPVEILVPGLLRPRLPLEDFGLEDRSGRALNEAHPGMQATLISERPELGPGLFLRTAWNLD